MQSQIKKLIVERQEIYKKIYGQRREEINKPKDDESGISSNGPLSSVMQGQVIYVY